MFRFGQEKEKSLLPFEEQIASLQTFIDDKQAALTEALNEGEALQQALHNKTQELDALVLTNSGQAAQISSLLEKVAGLESDLTIKNEEFAASIELLKQTEAKRQEGTHST
eukprot:GABW01003171.1.p1 GENE.GABW01003171.1~~GABW01003171.1.p1  ORF type:complete len:111 (-),score=15.23 GABW01003171.1:3-335(-)